MKFSELLGEPEPEPEEGQGSVAPEPPAHGSGIPEPDAAPISVFAPVPVAPPEPAGGRSGLAELNVRRPAPEPAPDEASVLDQLAGLDSVVDDLLPPRRGRR